MRDLSKLKQILQEAEDAVGTGAAPVVLSAAPAAPAEAAPVPQPATVPQPAPAVHPAAAPAVQPALAVQAAAAPHATPAPVEPPQPVLIARADTYSPSDGTEVLPPASERPAIVERRRGADRRGPRPSLNLQPAWLDPEEMPFTPQPRPGNPIASRVFSLAVLAVFVVAIAWLIVPEVHFRVVHQNEVQFSTGILTAQGVPLGPLEAAVVEDVLVDDLEPDAVIPAGTPLARLRTGEVDPAGESVYYDVSAPFDARLVSIGAPEGSTTQPGIPVLTVYDPTEMMVIVTVNQADLDLLRQGMTVSMHSPLFDSAVDGVLVAAVPILGTVHEPTASTLVNLKIRPDASQIGDLLPGLQFDVVIDLDSVPTSAPQLLYTTDPAARPS